MAEKSDALKHDVHEENESLKREKALKALRSFAGYWRKSARR
jgi:hypothetical protein